MATNSLSSEAPPLPDRPSDLNVEIFFSLRTLSNSVLNDLDETVQNEVSLLSKSDSNSNLLTLSKRSSLNTDNSARPPLPPPTPPCLAPPIPPYRRLSSNLNTTNSLNSNAPDQNLAPPLPERRVSLFVCFYIVTSKCVLLQGGFKIAHDLKMRS